MHRGIIQMNVAAHDNKVARLLGRCQADAGCLYSVNLVLSVKPENKPRCLAN